jgi:hypothetical protein
MFFRSRLVHEYGLLFNPDLRDAGDGEWMVRVLKQGTKTASLGQFTSAFTFTGANMFAGANATRERNELIASAPGWARVLRPAIIARHRLRRLLGGIYHQAPFSYDVYTLENPAQRRREEVIKPRFAWPKVEK